MENIAKAESCSPGKNMYEYVYLYVKSMIAMCIIKYFL